jgi:biopolymer transport protein ExbD
MQKGETSTIDAQAKKAEEAKPKPRKLIEIAVDEKNMVYVNWEIDKKDLSITALCEALKLVASYQKPVIIQPKPSIIDFIRGRKT